MSVDLDAFQVEHTATTYSSVVDLKKKKNHTAISKKNPGKKGCISNSATKEQHCHRK